MAFSALDLDSYLIARNITGARAEYIQSAARGLSRDVRPSWHASCVVEFQSAKMGVTVNTESRTAEFPFALQMEFDESVLAYYEQPPEVDVRRITKRDYWRVVSYHPDFLLLTVDGPKVIQVKLLAELEDLVATNKNWAKPPDGSFQDLPAQEALAAKNLPHIVVAIDTIDTQLAANFALMSCALRNSVEIPALVDRATSPRF